MESNNRNEVRWMVLGVGLALITLMLNSRIIDQRQRIDRVEQQVQELKETKK